MQTVVGRLQKCDLVSCAVEVLRCVYENVAVLSGSASSTVRMTEEHLAKV